MGGRVSNVGGWDYERMPWVCCRRRNPGGVWTPVKGRCDVHSQVPFSDGSNYILDVALDRSIKNDHFLALPLALNMTHLLLLHVKSPRIGLQNEKGMPPFWKKMASYILDVAGFLSEFLLA